MPANMPPPLGKDVDLQMMVDNDHAGDRWICQSRTGFLIFCNMALIDRMMGIPLSGPSYVYGVNKSVITNLTTPESTLKIKSNSICYHAIRESVAMG